MLKKFSRFWKKVDCVTQYVFTPKLEFKCTCSYHTRAQGGMGKNKGKPDPEKTPSVKRKIAPSDNKDLPGGSGVKPPPDKQTISEGRPTFDEMSWRQPANPLGPAQYTPPNSNDLSEAIEEVNSQEKANDNNDEEGASGGPSSYAVKAKKAKVDYPFALYILAGSEERKNLTLHHYVGYEEFLFNSVVRAGLEEGSKIKIDFSIFRNTYGLIACVDEFTSQYVKNLTKAYKYEEETTRAWNRWESEEATIYSVFLSGAMFQQPRCKPNWICGKILDLNQLPGDFRSATLDKKSNRDGAYLSFECTSKQLMDGLNARTRLNCILSNPVIHKRVRKSRSKEEFLGLFEKKHGDKN